MRSAAGNEFGSIFSLDHDAVASAFTWQAAGGGRAQTLTPLVYEVDAAGVPTALLAAGPPTLVAADLPSTWLTVPLPPTALAPGRYLLALASGEGGDGALTGYVSSADAGRYARTPADRSRGWSSAEHEDVAWAFALTLAAPSKQPAPPSPPQASEPPSVAGSVEPGATLTADPGSWPAGTDLTIAWERCTTAACTSTGVVGSAYTLGQPDVGSSVRVRVTAVGPGGTTEATSAATDVVPPRNLVPNASVETDPTRDYYTVGDGVFAWADDAAHSGSRSLRVSSGTAPSALARWLTAPGGLPVDAGRKYAVSGWLRLTGPNVRGSLAITFWRANGTFIGAAEIDDRGAHCDQRVWCAAQFETTSPSGATAARVEVRLSGVGSVWADDLAVRPAG